MKIKNENFIRELKNKNEKALEYVVRNYGGAMKAVIQRILYSYPEDTEECLYDSIFKIWENINSFDPNKSSFSNWACAVAKYSALDRLRKLTKYMPVLDIDEIQISDENSFTKNNSFSEFFSELISCLSEEDKNLFVRLFYYGATYDELSDELNKDKNILFNHVSRGKKKIIKCNSGLFNKGGKYE